MADLRILTPADPADWPVWRDARLAALADAPHAFRVRSADWHHGGEARWRARFDRPDAVHVVAVRDDGRPVGLACGLPGPDGGDHGAGTGGDGADERVGELRSVWVGPAARGQGVGDRLIAAVEEWARRAGSTSLRLAVIPGNEAAVALYRRHGFAPTGAPGGLLPDGVTRELVMAKRLRTA
ncbi:GNAT family N-acetyltransferase [Kitasatospora sp. NPDC058201]|uniref:GNAT family N-acetyltransferase n=1 Tax=unclassified Kitasatospora TaxID=2633591 RepID=UPI003665AAED